MQAGSKPLFDLLIAPLVPLVFLEECWERQPRFIPAEDRSAKPGLFDFDLAAFKRAAARIVEQPERTDYGMPALTTINYDQVGTVSERIRSDEIDSRYAAGFTVTLTGLQFLDARLALIAGRLRRQLAHPGNIVMQAFLSPGNDGVALHFDRSSVMSVQLEGAKQWRFSRVRAMEMPPDQATFKGRGSFERA